MSLNFKNDKILVKHLKKGNEQAYVFLLDTYHHLLSVYALGLTKDRAKAEDIVQNVFVKTWEFRERLQKEQSLKGYLYKLVYTEFIDQYRKTQSVHALEKKYHETLNLFFEENNIDELNSFFTQVNKKIQDLPPKCKQVFVLSKKEGLTNIEISEYLNVSVKTVEAQITKAFSVLRKHFQGKSKALLFLLFGQQTL